MLLETKIQIEALKAHENLIAVNYSQDNEFTYLTIDGGGAIKISNHDFLLDKSKLNEIDTLADIFNVNINNLFKLTDTGYRRLYMPNFTAVCFVCEVSKGKKNIVYCYAEELEKFSVKGVEFFIDKSMSTIYLAKNSKVYAVMRNFNFREVSAEVFDMQKKSI